MVTQYMLVFLIRVVPDWKYLESMKLKKKLLVRESLFMMPERVKFYTKVQ
jgi:hypothetical protein